MPSDERDPEDIDPADLPLVVEGFEQANRHQFAPQERVDEEIGRSMTSARQQSARQSV